MRAAALAGNWATIAGAGDIATVVIAMGDDAYPDGVNDPCLRYCEPSWGRHRQRTRPVVGNHDHEADQGRARFATAAGDLSGRAKSAAAIAWTPEALAEGEMSSRQRTPSLAAIVQEIVDLPGWRPGNAMSIFVSGAGPGRRVARAHEYDRENTPTLIVEYGPRTFGSLAALTGKAAHGKQPCRPLICNLWIHICCSERIRTSECDLRIGMKRKR